MRAILGLLAALLLTTPVHAQGLRGLGKNQGCQFTRQTTVFNASSNSTTSFQFGVVKTIVYDSALDPPFDTRASRGGTWARTEGLLEWCYTRAAGFGGEKFRISTTLIGYKSTAGIQMLYMNLYKNGSPLSAGQGISMDNTKNTGTWRPLAYTTIADGDCIQIRGWPWFTGNFKVKSMVFEAQQLDCSTDKTWYWNR